MQSMQRQLGKLKSKGGGDDAKVSVLIQDYEEAEKMLSQIIEASKAWRDAWVSILTVQLGVVTSIEELYNPIIGASSDGHGHEPALTPQGQLDRTNRLKLVYGELKTDLLEEVSMMDDRIIKPAMEAKEYIQPIKKTIKKRENKRLDYERYFDRVTHASRKQNRSERDDSSLAKAEIDLSKATDAFQVADAHLRETLPPIIAAAFSILPHLLAAQILIQNTILAQYYTVLHNYCQDEGFPSPPPPMEDMIAQWEADFKPIQKEVECTKVIARGKTVHTSMQLGDDANRKSSSLSGLNNRNNISSRRVSSQGLISSTKSPSMNHETPVMRITTPSSVPSTISRQEHDDPGPEQPPRGTHLSPTHPPQISYSPAGPTRDYFTGDRQLSKGSVSPGMSASAAATAGKKKPPPPPPKRIQSSNSAIFVIAIYDFEGQERGDLSFKEGDKIKVVNKTNSIDDWWDGELRGSKGRFPANYCEIWR